MGTILGRTEAPYIGEEFGDILVGFWWGLSWFKKALVPTLGLFRVLPRSSSSGFFESGSSAGSFKQRSSSRSFRLKEAPRQGSLTSAPLQGPLKAGQIIRISVCWDFEPLKVGSIPYRLGRY